MAGAVAGVIEAEGGAGAPTGSSTLGAAFGGSTGTLAVSRVKPGVGAA